MIYRPKKLVRYRQTNRPTNQPTNQPTNRHYHSLSRSDATKNENEFNVNGPFNRSGWLSGQYSLTQTLRKCAYLIDSFICVVFFLVVPATIRLQYKRCWIWLRPGALFVFGWENDGDTGCFVFHGDFFSQQIFHQYICKFKVVYGRVLKKDLQVLTRLGVQICQSVTVNNICYIAYLFSILCKIKNVFKICVFH